MAYRESDTSPLIQHSAIGNVGNKTDLEYPGFRRLVDSSSSLFGSVSLTHVLQIIVAEMLGTGILVFMGCMTGVTGLPSTPHPHLLVGLGFGFTVMLVIQIIGHISKAHINPAVTAGLVVIGNLNIPLAVVYVISQCVGATLGYGVLRSVLPAHTLHNNSNSALCVTQPADGLTALQAMLTELIITAILLLVVCAVFDWRNAGNTDSVPIRFGLTIAALAMVAGPFTGASMNPARSLGPAIWTSVWDNHWVYWVGPLGGGILAAAFYRFVFGARQKEPEVISEDIQTDQELPLTNVQSQESNEIEK